jgi:hypothetical protein
MKIKKQICKNGHDTFITGRYQDGHCRECKHEYRMKHKKERKILNKRYRENNLTAAIKRDNDYYEKNRARIIARQIVYENGHKEERKKYRQEHAFIYKIADLKKHKERSKRIVKWGQTGIDVFINKCSIGMTIDHIVPLLGKKVSGLHVIWNLQYLTPHENYTKRNKVNLLEASEWYGKILENTGLKDKEISNV